MALTNLEIKNAKPGMHVDGNGLYLQVTAGGSQSWIFRYQLNKKRREMGLGSIAHLPPVAARAEAARLRAVLAAGIDPIDERKAAKAAKKAEKDAAARETKVQSATFRAVAAQFIASQEAGWRNAKHAQQWTNTLNTYAYPIIGDLPVRDITSAHIIEVLRPIWSAKPETASRVRMRIEAVLNSAKLMGWRTGENPAIWRGGLEAALPRISKVRRVKHHAALAWQDMPDFIAALRQRDGMGTRALEFCILTAARSGEVRRARWDEIDLDMQLWTIPPEKMKAGRQHRVPLSSAAVDLLKTMPRISGCALVFPGTRKQPLSDMTLSAVLKRMGFGDYTVHGFRSTFRDWAAETTHHPSEVVEMALAHSVGNKVEAAYRRGDLFEKRRTLMADWAESLIN